MATHTNLCTFIQSFEGGYVNDPFDKGGETNKGITIAAWKQAGFDTSEKITSLQVGSKTYVNVTKSLYEMTDVQWACVFDKFYWSRWSADQIKDQFIADTLVDWIWASGSYGITIPQRILGVSADGKVGPATLAALNTQEPKKLFEKIQKARHQYIDDIIRRTPTNERYKVGWLRRIDSIRYGSLVLNNSKVIDP